jgi:hypothetical protein
MGSDWPSDGFDASTSEELERSMEQEVEGLLELEEAEGPTGLELQADSPAGVGPMRAARGPNRRAPRRRPT